jgi:hypothetical protein
MISSRVVYVVEISWELISNQKMKILGIECWVIMITNKIQHNPQ